MGRPPEAEETSPATGGRKRRLLGIAVVVVVYAVGLAFTNLRDGLEALREAIWWPLALAFLLEALTVATLAQVHRSSAAAVRGRIRNREALNVSMSAFTVSQTVPGGGAVAGALIVSRLQRFGLSAPQATASMVLTASLATVTIALIAAGGIVPEVLDAELPGIALAGVAALVVVLVGVVAAVVAVLRSPRLADRLLERAGRLHDVVARRVDDWRESLRVVHDDPPTLARLLRIVAWSLVNWSADIAALGMVFLAFGAPVSLTVLLVGFGVSQVGAAVPLTPGGVGFVESGMVAAFVALGTPVSLATTVVVAYRVLATWLPALAGTYMLVQPVGDAPDGDDREGPVRRADR
ncbi:YbhN family protein [Egicoccus sp. AB-alg6-2]|uniref:lysylphosphatidylglycerol synthase transmembrane domain-containing protein n=1 Tax=Egicoccus sp. AB-alg6-2 TaxID=3242692 RepID=UPI00359CF1AF